jgi:hypothetical protein
MWEDRRKKERIMYVFPVSKKKKKKKTWGCEQTRDRLQWRRSTSDWNCQHSPIGKKNFHIIGMWWYIFRPINTDISTEPTASIFRTEYREPPLCVRRFVQCPQIGTKGAKSNIEEHDPLGCFLVSVTLQPWRRELYFPPKLRWASTQTRRESQSFVALSLALLFTEVQRPKAELG